MRAGTAERLRQLCGHHPALVRPVGSHLLCQRALELLTALPYLLGGLLGGLVGGKLFPKIPVVWLRRAFALVIFYGAWKALTA